MIRRAVVVSTFVIAVAAFTVPAHAASTSDQQVAAAGVLSLADFPAGWQAGPSSSSSDAALDAAAAKVASCKPFLAFSRASRKNPRARSKDIEYQRSSVTNRVGVYPSVAKATVAMRLFAKPTVPSCFEQLFRGEFEQQLAKRSTGASKVTSVDVSIESVPDVRIGDQAVAYQGPVVVTLADGSRQTINVGIADVRVGKAIAGYSWTSDTDIASTLQPAIVKSLARLHTAQSAG